jgi:CHAT domain-containing protein
MGRARLVVLSACESASSDDPGGSGEEYLGLPAGFIVAGAQAVAGSLWSVFDPATALLMAEFYRQLLKGRAVAEAVRDAQLWLRALDRGAAFAAIVGGAQPDSAAAVRMPAEMVEAYQEWLEETDEKPFAHPHYWAAFAAFGAPQRLT